MVQPRDRAHVDPYRRLGRDHVHLPRLTGPQHRRGEVEVAQLWMRRRAAPGGGLPPRPGAPRKRASTRVRVATCEGHGAMGHQAGEVDPQPQRALRHVADLTTLGLAADGGVDAGGSACGRRSAWRPPSCPPRPPARPSRSAPGTAHRRPRLERRRAQPRDRTSCRRCPDRKAAVSDLGPERVAVHAAEESPSVTTSVCPSNSRVGPGHPTLDDGVDVRDGRGRPGPARGPSRSPGSGEPRAGPLPASLRPGGGIEHTRHLDQRLHHLDQRRRGRCAIAQAPRLTAAPYPGAQGRSRGASRRPSELGRARSPTRRRW